MKLPIRIRYILIIAFAVFMINTVNDSLKRSDYNHCLATSKMTKQQCQTITGYQLNK